MPATMWLRGFGLSAGLIIAIGAQNAFVLQQGIRRRHVLPVVLICGLTDALLEFLGVAGIGFVIELCFLGGRDKLQGQNVEALIQVK